MTTTADKIRALPVYAYLSAEAAHGFACAREAAAALVEAEPPQAVRVKGLVWPDFREGGTCGRPYHFQYFVTQDRTGRFWAHFDMSQHKTLEAAQAHCDQHYQRAALDLTPTAADASPAPDPVSPTPTLDAMAMRREVVGRIKLSCDLLALNGYAAFADRVMELIPVVEAITLPADAALAEALALPEVKALVEAAEAVIRDFHGDNAIGVAHLTKLRAALKGVK